MLITALARELKGRHSLAWIQNGKQKAAAASIGAWPGRPSALELMLKACSDWASLAQASAAHGARDVPFALLRHPKQTLIFTRSG